MGASSQHFNGDDLFAMLLDTLPELGGPGPFVINLSSSNVPISLPNSGIAIAPNARVYQIRRTEDRSVRYRLRLGPFVTEAQANAALAIVRDTYPAALTATATPEDLASLADLPGEAFKAPASTAAAAKPAAPAPQKAAILAAKPSAAELPAVPVPPTLMLSTPIPTLAPTSTLLATKASPAVPALSAARVAAKPSATAAPASAASPARIAATLTPGATPASAATASAASVQQTRISAASSAPRVAKAPTPIKKATLKSLGFPAAKTSELAPPRAGRVPPKPAQPPAKPGAPTVAPTAPAVPVDVKSLRAPAEAAPTIAKPIPTVAARAWPSHEDVSESARSLESTQTLRTLTASEIEDPNTLRWFAIELAVSDRAFDPEAVPNLDIFSIYRLYAVEAAGSGAVVHTLRLGFFSESFAAQAVADYLADHYAKPVVKRVSIAERERFSQQCIEARKNVEATGRHAVIEITDQRYVRERRAAY